MPIAPEALAAIEDILNRVAVESVLAAPGRDDGLIPTYSLLGEMREQTAPEPALRAPVDAVYSDLEKRLDAGQPFDAGCLDRLQKLIEWLPRALDHLRAGQPVPELAPVVIASAAGGAGESKGGEAVLSFELEENRELLTEFYGEAVEHLQQIEAALLELEHEPEQAEALNSIFRSFHTIKGNAGFLGLTPMRSLAHEVESLLDLARNHKLRLNSAIITEILRSRDALQALTHQLGLALEKGQMPDRIIPVSHLVQSVRRLAVPTSPDAAPGPAEEAAPSAAEGSAPAAQAASRPAEAPAVSASAEGAPKATVRVNTEKLDSLMDMVGELVIVQSQLMETGRGLGASGATLQRDLAQLNRITKELQHTAMSLRMIPIKPTFQKMERMMRDLARDCDKRVVFETSGEDTELDRTVVEEIGDPLVHMVRNAIDHGIEPPADRLAQGKPESGSVHLRAYYQGSSVVVELRDDGRGIDPEKIVARARRLQLIPEDAALSREDAFGLIFLPGFSTAEKVTSMSGRGVGMDVVKRNIQRLRGTIEVSSEVGRGSVFKIRLPLTMAIIDGLVVRVGEDRFILPATSVQMALRPTRENVVKVQGRGEVIDLRGKMLVLHRLNRRFGIVGRAQEPWEGIVVIVESSGKSCALLVDEMVNKQEVVIKSLGGFFQGLAGVAGGAILGDGNIALILDPAALLQAA